MAHTAIGHFMNQKDFHPANFHNQKRVWIAQEKLKADAAREKERIAEYQAEAAVHDTKGYALMGKKESDIAVKRHAVNFMYDAPPGMEKKDGDAKLELDADRQLRLDEKFQVLKGAPREDYAKDLPARDNPFGTQIRNVQCRRCQAWGHQNTDRECPLFGTARLTEDGEAERQDFEDPVVLMRQMAEDGFALKQTVLGRRNDVSAENQQIVVEPEEDREAAFLASLSSSEKRRLHKKLEKLDGDPEKAAEAIAEFAADIASGIRKSKKSKSKKDKKDKSKKEKKSKKKAKKRKHRDYDVSDSDSESDSEHRPRRDRSPIRSSREHHRDDHELERHTRENRADGHDQWVDRQRDHSPRVRSGDDRSDPSRPNGGYSQPRMDLKLSDAAYKLTGRAAPPQAQRASTSEVTSVMCYRCGREGHTRFRCKEHYHKSGSRLMKGH